LLEDEGTLDVEHMLQYVRWGKVPLADNEVETCKFLRSIESGGGASEAKSQAFLSYAKSLGGRGDLLPKTMETCWKTVSRVRFISMLICRMFILTYVRCSLRIHCNVQFHIHSSYRMMFIAQSVAGPYVCSVRYTSECSF
jgi:hypothetical protein